MGTVILHSNPFYGNPLHSNSFLHNIHLYFTAATTHTYYVNLQQTTPAHEIIHFNFIMHISYPVPKSLCVYARISLSFPKIHTFFTYAVSYFVILKKTRATSKESRIAWYRIQTRKNIKLSHPIKETFYCINSLTRNYHYFYLFKII